MMCSSESMQVRFLSELSAVDLSCVSLTNAKQQSFSFDITTDFPLCGGRERVPALSEDLHQIL